MSRNNLMQQLQYDPSPRAGPEGDPVTRNTWGERASGAWAREEALKLAQQVFLAPAGGSPQMVVFAGIEHGNGCSRVCASVAETLAVIAQGPVCLVEANFRSPALPKLFGTTNHHGLVDALGWEGPIHSFTKPVGVENLWLLSCGNLIADSASLLASEAIKERLSELRSKFRFVIVDAPPLTRYADAMVVGQMADGVVLVLEAGVTRREHAHRVVGELRSSHVPILGAVLNKRTFPIPEKIYDKL
ncbi:MAG TPA: CpsD/CapB family tyrosine-protein kinase [Terriglobia bacterium]|nr:CpsD/CapB family tyrosine-protein kinase [Terriglobia bacterium]